jgi:hypothetical protein
VKRLGALSVFSLSVLLLTTTTTAPAQADAGATVPRAAAKTPVDRTITDSRITESSGLAPSLLHPGVIWTHNDSGNSPRIYAIGKNGKTTAALRLNNFPNRDWEAIASFRGPAKSIASGESLIAVGDIGDNNAAHPNVRIAIVREPKSLKSGSISPIRVIRLTYPGGPRDAEALLSDPQTGQLYIVSKTLFGSTLYSVPLSVWPGGGGGTSKITTMTKVATMGASFITDGAFLPNGRMLIRGYGQVYVVDPPSSVQKDRLDVLASASLPDQDQGESIAVIDGGRKALIGSEGRNEPVYRISVPLVDGKPASGPAATLPATSGKAAATSTQETGGAVADPHFTGVGSLRIWVALIGGGFGLIVLTLAVLMFSTRRRY